MTESNLTYIEIFLEHLSLERSMSENTIDAYKKDIEKLAFFSEDCLNGKNLKDLTPEDLSMFLEWVAQLELSARSQARVLSAVKHFYNLLLTDGKIDRNPAYLMSGPKFGMYIPTVLSVEEIDEIEKAVDLSRPDGERNRAIIETLFSCGLRVSELINLKIQDINKEIGFVRIFGKGNKMRLVPISALALKYIGFYNEQMRCHLNPDSENRELTRVMIFKIVKQLCEKANITKTVSPHTFRHSFATHLVKGGANLKAVQEMLGHESIQTTEIYTHLDSEYLRDTIMSYHPRNRQN